ITDSAIALDYGINAHYMGQAYQEAVIAIGVSPVEVIGFDVTLSLI
ncbi:hypothetical protein Tco_0929673, partial [Tanacetum coccineum]